MANHRTGLVPISDRIAKAAMPIMEPAISMAYARNGGIERSNGPSGSASVASMAVTSTTIIGRTTKLTSALFDRSTP